MTKEEFAQLFRHHLDLAAQNAEERYKITVPRNFLIELHDAGYSPRVPIDVDTAIDALFIDENTFFRVIDIMVIEVRKSATRVFVRPSGHHPEGFERTWNNPAGNGPFKRLISLDLRVVDDE